MAFNGPKHLANNSIVPLMGRMTNAGNVPIPKIYPDVAHFIHADDPVGFPAGLMHFVQTGKVETGSPLAIDGCGKAELPAGISI
jgi:hypothetical protein